jgi:hypothetical protein
VQFAASKGAETGERETQQNYRRRFCLAALGYLKVEASKKAAVRLALSG